MSLLIVEDNTISIRMLEVMLVTNGFEVVTAKTGRQALERLAEREDVQMVVTDLMMPEMDGMQLLEEMRGHPRYKDLPVLVVSSLNDAETVRRVVLLGCRNYLVKPLKEDVLIPKVRSLLVGTPPVSKPGPLRAKFDVLHENGLGVEQFETLFDTFCAQAREVVAAIGASDPLDEAATRAVAALKDGAAILTTGRLLAAVERSGEAGGGDVAELRGALDEVVAAMESAIEKRNRMKQKLEQGEASVS